MTTTPSDNASNLAAVAKHWDAQTGQAQPKRTRWWESRTILRHVNQIVCGEPLDGPSAGFHAILSRTRPQGYDRAISIGCGAAYKEANLVQAGIVKDFFLYEVSGERVKQGREFAASRGIADRMHFIQADAFASCDEQFDLVYWNNALHHMMDVPAAITWSRDHLVSQGVFAMDDYVGASRFQWSDYSLRVASQFRQSLTAQHRGGLPAQIHRPSAEKVISIDPSEAADSGRTMSALRETFPHARIYPTGGAIYHAALNDIIGHIEEDSETLLTALLLDQVLADLGETHYGVAIAIA